MKAKVNGSWKDTNPYAKINGAWKEGTYVFSKINGVWKKVFQKYPEVTGGTLTSDETYYYRTFTANDTLTVTGGSVNFDYVIVGGGGGGGAAELYNYGTCSYDTYTESCNYYAGNCNSEQIWDCYWNSNDGWLYCEALSGWGCGRSYLTVGWDGGGGGAGGLVIGSTTMAPGSTPIVVGAGGTGGTNDGANNGVAPTNGGNSSAFGITATGGGAGAGRHGAASQGASGGGCSGSYPGAASNNASQGKSGSHTRTDMGYGQNYCNGGQLIQSMWTAATNGYLRNINWNGRNLCQPGWGGGAGGVAHESSSTQSSYGWLNVICISSQWGNFSGTPYQTVDATVFKNAANLSDMRWAPLNSLNEGGTQTYVETVGSSGTMSRMSIWDTNFGIGVDVFGLKVAGGGMGGYNARSLSKSYGGGYPMNATTSQGTYSVHGSPNTGGGGGGAMYGYSNNGGNGGSGVVRIRYLRSSVGG